MTKNTLIKSDRTHLSSFFYENITQSFPTLLKRLKNCIFYELFNRTSILLKKVQNLGRL